MNDKGIQIVFKNLSVGYTNQLIIGGINISLNSNQLLALVGRNGSGKTTFFKVLINELAPIEGEVILEGQSIRTFNIQTISRKISIVFTGRQDTMGLAVHTILEMGRHPYTDRIGRITEEDAKRIKEIVDLMKIEFLLDKKMEEISDGECQKIMIARALIQDTPIVLLDEPMAFLDYTSKKELMKSLRDIVNSTGKLILFSSHELNLLPRYVDGILSVSDKKMRLITENLESFLTASF